MMLGNGECDRCNQLASQINQNELENNIYREGAEASLVYLRAENQRLRDEIERLKMPVCVDTTYRNAE